MIGQRLLFGMLLALAGCSDGGPTRVTLAELKAQPQAYDGRQVEVSGTVRGFHDPRHYWLEDDRINRVGLLPEDRIAPHLDRQISVTGRFSFSRERGRRIMIEHIASPDPER